MVVLLQQQPDEEKNTSIDDLPSCIMIEILSRLPLQILINSCRFVCKSWNQYFLDPSFSAAYASNGSTYLMIPVSHRTSDTITVVDDDSQDCSDIRRIKTAAPPKYPLRLTNINYRKDQKHTATVRRQVRSFCEGFVCLCDEVSGNPVSVWNPMLHEYVMLPPVTSAVSESKYSRVISGLGFSDRKLKVLRIYKPESTDDHEALWEAEINTVGTDAYSWRNIGKVPYQLTDRFYSTYFNGGIHWRIKEGHASELICCLGMKNERFSCLPSPPIFNHKRPADYRWSNIGVFEDSLHICAKDASAIVPPIQVWLMKDYGVKESWIQIFKIQNPHIDWWVLYCRFELVKVLRNGNIMLLCGDNSLLCYDLSNQCYTNVWNQKSMIVVPLTFASLNN